MHKNLLSEIDEFLAERGISDHRFGMLAAKNGRLVERLREGGRVWPETADMVRTFIRREREQMRRTERAAS